MSPTEDEQRCPGCAFTSCACARHSSATSKRPETSRQARTWEIVKETYVRDGFCHPCSVQAAYGHQLGFNEVARVCEGCRGKWPSYRNAGERAQRWAETSTDALLVTDGAAEAA